MTAAMAVEDATLVAGLCIDETINEIVVLDDKPPFSWWRRTRSGELVRLR